jgi:signal transduction histidine kinase/ActR/RegA family two-component response regulator
VLATGVMEANEVSRALELAGRRAQEATRTLESKVESAVGEARQAQAALLEGQKLEAIGRLTGGLAHDFNNLLQTISTALYVLNRNIPGESPHRRFVDAAIRASTKAADLVKQMMSFGRAQPLNPQSIDLRLLVLQSQELTRKAVGERIRMTADLAPGLPPVLVDPVHLELALLNIFFNARDAMPAGGSITITARLALPDETSGLNGTEYVCLEVRDDGDGMNEETRARAFEPYFTTKPIGAGSGLGLSQVMSFAVQSHGHVKLDSTLGVGTSIRLFLPVSRGAATSIASIQNNPRVVSHSLRVLMVEDDALVSSVVAPVLRDAGHDVTLCENADLALQLLESRTDFDVLFSDIVMPGKLTGLDLVAWCQVKAPHLALVVATGYSSQQSRIGVVELRKPYAFDDMLATLQQAVDAKRPAGADR